MNRATTAEFLPSSVSAETGLMRAIDHACVQSSPFPHVFIRDVFPKSYYELMRQNFPNPALLISNGEAGRGNNLQARFVFELKPNYLETLPDEQRQFWSGFADWILCDRLRQFIIAKFSDSITRRFGSMEHLEFWSDAVLVEDQTTHSMGPHTDHPRKVVTLLFYLPGDESQIHLGTSIYRPKDPAFVCSGMAHHAHDKFDRAITFPFVPNALVMFTKSDISFHGVEPINDINCRRWLLMLNVNVRDPTDPVQ